MAKKTNQKPKIGLSDAVPVAPGRARFVPIGGNAAEPQDEVPERGEAIRRRHRRPGSDVGPDAV